MLEKIIGILILVFAIIGGFLIMGGELSALWHPSELVVIWGAALAAFLLSASGKVIWASFVYTGLYFSGGRVNKKIYRQLLGVSADLFKLSRSEGVLALENHLVNPRSSRIFQAYPLVLKHPLLRDFYISNLALLTMTSAREFDYQQHLDEQVHRMIQQELEVPKAINKVGDWLPGFGIVAAIMGVIMTMSQLGGDVTLIGQSIGAALVGTFIGILTAFALVAPFAHGVEVMIREDEALLETAAVALNGYAEGLSPGLTVEITRQRIPNDYRPKDLK